MPRRQHDHWEDSSSSEDHDDHAPRGTGNRRNVKYGSSCGIRSLNEYQDRLCGKERRTAQSYVETGDSAQAWAGAQATDHQNGHVSSAAHAGAALASEGNHTAYRAKAGASAEFGLGGAIADAGADATVYSYADDVGEIEVAKGHIGGGLGIGAGGGKAKVEAGVDIVDVNIKLSEHQAFDVNIGLNADTGIEAGVDGVSASFLGLGFSAGRNTGISTPFGGFSFKLW